MEYKVVDAKSKEELEEKINKHIDEWAPSGGVCCAFNPESSEFYFFQAIVKRN